MGVSPAHVALLKAFWNYGDFGCVKGILVTPGTDKQQRNTAVSLCLLLSTSDSSGGEHEVRSANEVVPELALELSSKQ